MKPHQIPAAIAAMLNYATECDALNAVSMVKASLGTYGVDPRDGALYGSAVEFRARVERKTGKRYSSLSADVQELFEVHHAVTVATAPELYDDEGCPMGADLRAHGEFVRSLAVA